MPKAIGIYRETKLAGKPGADQLILNFTAKELERKGFEMSLMFPSNYIKEKAGDRETDLIFSMARNANINDYLSLVREKKNTFMINSPAAIRVSFNRYLTYEKIEEMGVRVPQTSVYNIDELQYSDFEGKVILKPADRHEFWFVVEKEFHFEAAMKSYNEAGIDRICVQKFMKGEHLKFYAVGDKVIFPKDSKDKFSTDILEKLEKDILICSEASGLKIFGGDFIIDTKDNNKAYCVDVNDWPSFGTIGDLSQEEAGIEIANYIDEEYKKFQEKKSKGMMVPLL